MTHSECRRTRAALLVIGVFDIVSLFLIPHSSFVIRDPRPPPAPPSGRGVRATACAQNYLIISIWMGTSQKGQTVVMRVWSGSFHPSGPSVRTTLAAWTQNPAGRSGPKA